MSNKNKSSQQSRLLTALSKTTRGLTASQIRIKLKIASPSGVICHLRDEGHEIDSIKAKRNSAEVVYRLAHSRFTA